MLARGEKVVMINTIIVNNKKVGETYWDYDLGRRRHRFINVTDTTPERWQRTLLGMAERYSQDENFHMIELKFSERQNFKEGREVSELVPQEMKIIHDKYKRKIISSEDIMVGHYEYVDISYTRESGNMFSQNYIRAFEGDVIEHIKAQGIKEVVLVGAMDDKVIPNAVADALHNNPDVHITVEPALFYPYKTDENGSPQRNESAELKEIALPWEQYEALNEGQITSLPRENPTNTCVP